MKLEEALNILRNCDPTDDRDCDVCPIGPGNKIEWEVHPAGINLLFSTCSLLKAIEESLESRKKGLFAQRRG